MPKTLLRGLALFVACLPAALLLWGLTCPAALAHGLPTLASPAWCDAHTKAGGERHAQCQQAEAACRAALPDMASAGGCPDRQLDHCLARLGDAGSWCAVLCCLDADDAACRAAKQALPDLAPLLEAQPQP